MSRLPSSGTNPLRATLSQPLFWLLVAFAIVVGASLAFARSWSDTTPTATPESTAPAVAGGPPPAATAAATPAVALQSTRAATPAATSAKPSPAATVTTKPATTGASPAASPAAFAHPWTLSGKHAQTACASCHATSAKPSTLCSTCHATPALLHAQTPHNLAACDACHRSAGVSWAVAVDTCLICHKDRQQHYPTRECFNCHAFKAGTAAFVHPASLAGRHASAACNACHTSGAKPATACATCHQQSAGLHANAAHTGQACSTCHGTAFSGWKGVSQQTCTGACHANKTGHYPTQPCAACHAFTGQAVGYAHVWPLSGKHAATACKSCHTGSGKPDPTCATCHKTTGGALHATVTHTKTTCQTCHGTSAAGWSGVGAQPCLACHANKAEHFTGTACTTCHAFTPRGTTFQHTSWPLSGKHQTAACSRCHTSSAKPSTSCTACHQAPNVELHRKDVHIRNTCQTCHGTTYNGWVVQRQSCLNCHGNDSSYKEKSIHATTTALCSSCHRFK